MALILAFRDGCSGLSVCIGEARGGMHTKFFLNCYRMKAVRDTFFAVVAILGLLHKGEFPFFFERVKSRSLVIFTLH